MKSYLKDVVFRSLSSLFRHTKRELNSSTKSRRVLPTKISSCGSASTSLRRTRPSRQRPGFGVIAANTMRQETSSPSLGAGWLSRVPWDLMIKACLSCFRRLVRTILCRYYILTPLGPSHGIICSDGYGSERVSFLHCVFCRCDVERAGLPK